MTDHQDNNIALDEGKAENSGQNSSDDQKLAKKVQNEKASDSSKEVGHAVRHGFEQGSEQITAPNPQNENSRQDGKEKMSDIENESDTDYSDANEPDADYSDANESDADYSDAKDEFDNFQPMDNSTSDSAKLHSFQSQLRDRKIRTYCPNQPCKPSMAQSLANCCYNFFHELWVFIYLFFATLMNPTGDVAEQIGEARKKLRGPNPPNGPSNVSFPGGCSSCS